MKIEPALGMMQPSTIRVSSSHVRMGIVLAPDGSEFEVEGVLNPGITRDRNGKLLMYPRMVAAGNVSRIGLVSCEDVNGEIRWTRRGLVLEPERDFERRSSLGGHGCEDPRVTFVHALDGYVMTYTAFGESGARIAIAFSRDGYSWLRLGLLRFADDAINMLDNKDAAFFPDPVYSPRGVYSFAIYHRPMLPNSINGQTPIPIMQSLKPADRECLCIAYVPVESAVSDMVNLCYASESAKVLEVGESWGSLKNGAGTPPVRTPLGWLSIFHAVDAVERAGEPSLYYRAGIVLHDLLHPHLILYRSPTPVLDPITASERYGTVNDVVFPTGLDALGEDTFDVYYGAADARIARVRFTIILEAD